MPLLRLAACALSVALVLALSRTAVAVTFDECGGVQSVNTTAAAIANSAALIQCFLQANASASDRMVLIPAGTTYFIMNSTVSDLFNITFRISGLLVVNNDIASWPWSPEGAYNVGAVQFEDSTMLTLDGGGVLDGQGYMWWWYAILGGFDDRPCMVHMVRCSVVVIRDLLAMNSPTYHFYLEDMIDVLAENVTVHVDTEQYTLLSSFGLVDSESGIPIFPLNTDGIDISGINARIHNISITNYDDTVCMKPLNGNNRNPCTSNITVTNLRVHMGVGASVGSVPPDPAHNCIANILFEDVSFLTPFKAIYVKPNPGTVGTGEISNITYRRLTVEGAVWYPIWIGPQQQDQPGTNSTRLDCSFLFPAEGTICPADPLVPMSNIHIDGFKATGSTAFVPAVVLCNETAPCTGFVFESIDIQGHFNISPEPYCANAEIQTSEVSPPIVCDNSGRETKRRGQ